jgi:hypothetical protein
MCFAQPSKHGFSMPYFELRPRDDYPINTPRAIAL